MSVTESDDERDIDSLDVDDEEAGDMLPADGGAGSAGSSKKFYMTPTGHQSLKDEYLRLYRDERPKLVEVIAWAASNGDRSENADYIYGKRRLREIDKRLFFLTKRLESAVVVDPKQHKGDQVVFGATVQLEDEDGARVTYQIVGEDEANPSVGKISWLSPVAKALMGRSQGDEVVVQRPAGEVVFTIVSLRYC